MPLMPSGCWLIGRFHGGEFDVQAATGLPSLLVLLLVMNWFFHKVYWTGWISSHHRRRRGLLLADSETNQRRLLFGLALLGFTSVYRECFETVISLQNLRELSGAGVVELEGVVIGLLFTAAAGVLTFAGQFIALAIVMGSYVGAQYVRVWRPRRRGRRPAQIAVAPPEKRPGDRGSRRAPANALA